MWGHAVSIGKGRTRTHVLVRAATLWLLAAASLPADERTQRLTRRLAEEAASFQKVAVGVTGREALRQRAAKGNSETEWEERDIVSRYAFAVIGGGIHEIRQVVSVDRKNVKSEMEAQAVLAHAVSSSGDDRKRQLLRQWEKFGLRGGVTDFGQLLLLFTNRGAERYEFTAVGPNALDQVPAFVFRYQQIDGQQGVTLFRGKRGEEAQRLRMEGEIWVRSSDGLPMRITVKAANEDSGRTLMEEATVDYAWSELGCLLPASVKHREFSGGRVVSQNDFTYSDYARPGPGSTGRGN